MTSVRDRAYNVLRAYGVTTVFGNPGFTELPFLAGFPDDFTYHLGLQEAAVIGMADGFAQASGRPVLVNLHNAPGVGNALGNLKTAYHNKTPLIITAGQQRRDMLLNEPGFFAKDARDLPKPYVKWSYEPARAQDIPAALARAILIATQAPAGPVFLSLPLDDWEAEADPEPTPIRTVSVRTAPDPDAVSAAATRIAASVRPALIMGAGVDRSRAFDVAVQLAEKLNAEVYGAPGASNAGFPETHPLFRFGLTFEREALRRALTGHDLIVVIGAAVFDFDAGGIGPTLPDGAELIQFTDDPEEAARSLVGDAVVGDVGLAMKALVAALPTPNRTVASAPAGNPLPEQAPDAPISAHTLFAALEAHRPADSVIVLEASSHGSAMHQRMRMATPGGFYYAGVGGIGFALPCAVGVQLAEPDRRVICALGDGALLYSVQAIWTAVKTNARVVIIVLDNRGYVVLKESGDFLGVGHDQPGLDVSGVDHLALARGFGAEAYRIERADELVPAFEKAFKAKGPVLLSIAVDSATQPLLS
jgi:benzoylformate decarboxylase